MNTSKKQEFVDAPDPAFAEYGKAIESALGILRRQGLPDSIDPNDLRQQAEITLSNCAAGTPARAIVIARNAMIDFLKALRAKKRGGLGVTRDEPEERNDSEFFTLPVDDYRPLLERTGKIRTLASRHADWEAERAAMWASIRGVEDDEAVAA